MPFFDTLLFIFLQEKGNANSTTGGARQLCSHFSFA